MLLSTSHGWNMMSSFPRDFPNWVYITPWFARDPLVFFLQPEHVSDKLDLREWLGMLCIQGKKEIHDEYYIYPPELKRPPVSSECKTCCCTILAPAKLSSIVRVPLHKHWRKIVSIFIRLIFAYLPWVVMQMDEFKYLSNVYFYHKIEIFVSRHSFSVFFLAISSSSWQIAHVVNCFHCILTKTRLKRIDTGKSVITFYWLFASFGEFETLRYYQHNWLPNSKN